MRSTIVILFCVLTTSCSQTTEWDWHSQRASLTEAQKIRQAELIAELPRQPRILEGESTEPYLELFSLADRIGRNNSKGLTAYQVMIPDSGDDNSDTRAVFVVDGTKICEVDFQPANH